VTKLTGNHPKYSLCITNYNSYPYTKDSIQSIQPLLLNDEFEAVVVDNFSTDGSAEILQELSESLPNVHFFRERCNRGQGRDLAFRNSMCDYLITNIDMDVIYDCSAIRAAIEQYHRDYEGKILSIYGAMIMARMAVQELGGWKSLDRHEDTELAVNAFEHKMHAQDLSLNAVKSHLKSLPWYSVRRYKDSALHYRDYFRIGYRFSDNDFRDLKHPTALAGKLLAFSKKKYRHEQFSSFYRIWTSGVNYGKARRE